MWYNNHSIAIQHLQRHGNCGGSVHVPWPYFVVEITLSLSFVDRVIVFGNKKDI